MFDKVIVTLPPGRVYTAYLNGERIEIVGTLDGYTTRLGSARWDGRGLVDLSVRLRADAVRALTDAIRLRGARRRVASA